MYTYTYTYRIWAPAAGVLDEDAVPAAHGNDTGLSWVDDDNNNNDDNTNNTTNNTDNT